MKIRTIRIFGTARPSPNDCAGRTRGVAFVGGLSVVPMAAKSRATGFGVGLDGRTGRAALWCDVLVELHICALELIVLSLLPAWGCCQRRSR
jgi:hypothetical protein